MDDRTSRLRLERVEGGHTATPLELYFDLVFVFALTQVTAFLAADPTATGLVRGLLIMALLWWSWVGYSWLGNLVRADEGGGRVAFLMAMAAMFAIALCIPESFDDLPGGWHAPTVIAICYLAFRSIHLGMMWRTAAGDRAYRTQVARFGLSMLAATALLLAAAGAEGNARTAFWLAAVVADYVGTLAAGASGWRLRSAGHFAERHGLIVIVALGESIVAIGVGIAERPVSGPVLLAAALGLGLAAAMWWAYFDTSSIVAEHGLAACPEERRPRVARDAYSFLHLPMVAGIVLVALGMKKTLEYVADTANHEFTDPLTGVPLAALVVGVTIYLAGQVAFLTRCTGKVTVHRLVVAVAVLPLLAVGPKLAATATVGVLLAALVAMLGWESHRYAEERHRVRHGLEHE